MQEFLQHDLSTRLLSISVLLGWLGIGFVFLRILAISIKKLLEYFFKNSNKWIYRIKFKTLLHNKNEIGIMTYKNDNLR